MARFLIVTLALAVAALVVFGVVQAVGQAMRVGRDRVMATEMGNATMQKLSFVLLCALIFYVSIWGGA
jgi:hypothetical protein